MPAAKVAGLAAQATLPTESPEDIERACALAKISVARIDALAKALKAQALIREEKQAAMGDKVAGQDIGTMTTEQLREFASKHMLGTRPEDTVVEAGPAEYLDNP